MTEPTLTLTNPITCAPGLTGEVPIMMLDCAATVVDGVVTEIRINCHNPVRITDVAPNWRYESDGMVW